MKAEFDIKARNNYAPVVLFTYNRLAHTVSTIESLKKNELSEDTELYIFSDAAKSKLDRDSVDKVRWYLHEIKKERFFKDVYINEAVNNRGLQQSIIEGVSEIINRYGKVIVLEDDIVTSSDFLRFMNLALDFYKDDKNIWSISGHNMMSDKIQREHYDVTWGYRGFCWGWGSWSDRWNRIDWDVKTYERFIKNKKEQKKFNRGGRDLTSLLTKQMNGQVNSWAIRWCYQQYLEEMISIFPKNTKTINIGMDGSGTNCGNMKQKEQKFVIEDKWNFSYDMKNRKLVNCFRNYYYLLYYRAIIGKYYYGFLGNRDV